MSYRRLVFAISVISLAASAAFSQELGVRSYGLRGGINMNPDQFNFGLHVNVGSLTPRVRLQPSAEIGLGNGVRLASTNFDALYLFAPRSFRPYAGGGLGINFVDVQSGIGSTRGLDIEPVLNVVAGVEWGSSRPGSPDFRRYLLEARLGFGDTPDLKLVVGYSF